MCVYLPVLTDYMLFVLLGSLPVKVRLSFIEDVFFINVFSYSDFAYTIIDIIYTKNSDKTLEQNVMITTFHGEQSNYIVTP